MGGEKSGHSGRGVWLVALVALAFLAMVGWDQFHARGGHRKPRPRATAQQRRAESGPADQGAITVTPAPGVHPRPATASDQEPVEASGDDGLPEGVHAM